MKFLNTASGSPLDVVLLRETSAIIAERDGTNAQSFRWYRTFTDASNYLRGVLSSIDSGIIIAAETAGTGADNQNLYLNSAGAAGLVSLNGTFPILQFGGTNVGAAGLFYAVGGTTLAFRGTSMNLEGPSGVGAAIIAFTNSPDVGITRNADGIIEINSASAGTFRDIKYRKARTDSTIITAGTTGAQTINKAAGRVNFAGAATSLVVTNSLCTTSSIIHVTKATNDATARLGAAVAASGSFTIYMDVAPAAECAVNFMLQGD